MASRMRRCPYGYISGETAKHVYVMRGHLVWRVLYIHTNKSMNSS